MSQPGLSLQPSRQCCVSDSAWFLGPAGARLPCTWDEMGRWATVCHSWVFASQMEWNMKIQMAYHLIVSGGTRRWIFFSQALDFRRHWTDAFSGGAGVWVGHTDPSDGHCFPWIGPVLPSHQIFTLGMATSLSHGCGLLIHSSNSPISASSKRSYHCGWVLSRFRDIWLDA